MKNLQKIATILAATLVLLTGCDSKEPVSEARYASVDRLYASLAAAVDSSSDLRTVVGIDHSRLAAAEGVVMPPARVLLASAPKLEAALLALDQRVAIDLPLRALAYEAADGEPAVIYNDFAFVAARYGLDPGMDLAALYHERMASMLGRIDPAHVRRFETNTMSSDGINDLVSQYDFETTVQRVRAAIDSQGDTVWFGEVDYQAVAAEAGIGLRPTILLLFGGPAPGGKAMAEAPTLGLDAFCQKLLVWEDAEGKTHVSFNDLLALARRQGVPVSAPLRVINYRLKSTFREAAQG